MLEANHLLPNSAMAAFRESMTEGDKVRLDREIDSYAKELVSAMLFRSEYETLFEMLSDKEISPLLFQWALAVRDGVA
jgi:hypothetical protein